MNSYLPIFGDIKDSIFVENEPLAPHSTMRAGGTAALAAFPHSADALCALTETAQKENIKHFVIGNGSNVVFPDGCYDGVIIFTKNMKNISFFESSVSAECGVNLIYLSSLCSERGLSGLEFACDIPASVGGAVYMNAGAHGGSISNVFSDGKFYLPSRGVIKKTHDEMNFSYRESAVRHSGEIILSASFSLFPRDKSEIVALTNKYRALRRAAQPSGFPSAGSAFLPSCGKAAWEYIDGAGLRGFSVGGAQISEKHAGFIVNTGGATSSDIEKLVEIVRAAVYEKYGVTLQTEIIFVK